MPEITALDELLVLADDDYFPVVDTSETATKRVKFENLRHSTTLDYIMQSDNTDQAIVATTAAQVITFDTNVSSQGITRTSSSRFTITTAGSYLIVFSGICSGVINESIAIWMRKGSHVGASTVADNVANSNTIYPFKSTGLSAVVSVTFIESFAVDEWFEFLTWGSHTSNKWDYTAAVADNPGVTPGRPACPSIIFTANRI